MMIEARNLREVISDAVARLVSVREFGQTCVVSVPVAYPSGAHAGVHISVSGDKCFVSDCALGLREAEMAGASDYFDQAAKDAADWFGVGYDGASVFAASAPLDRIQGAIVGVANASTTAVGRSLLKAAESKERQRNSELYDRVRDVFGAVNVAKKMEIAGGEASWDVHNVVTLGSRLAVFEFVAVHSHSVASKFIMFSDIVKLPNPPALNSVVVSLADMSKKQRMLGDVSNVIEINSDADTFRRYARAA